MLLFIGVVLLKALDTNRLKGSVFSLFNINFIESESEENTSFFDSFKIVIFMFTVIVLSLLAYRFKTYRLSINVSSFSSYLPVF
ncbi:hypothetical protein [Polaribacter filamentus]|nr:hypothetical protein [Polaribacter filamentus]